MQVDLEFYIEDKEYTLTFDWFDETYYAVIDDEGNVVDLSDEDDERAWQQVQIHKANNEADMYDHYKYLGAE